MRLRAWSIVAGICVLLTATESNAQSQYESEYTQRLKVHQTIDPHGPTPFGEEVNPYTGDLTFSQTDLVLEGVGPAIHIARNAISNQVGEGIDKPYSMGDWALSIPRIETLTDTDWHLVVPIDPGTNWDVRTSDPANKYKRCTYFDRPAYHGTLDDPNKGWNGMTLILADGSRHSILKRNAGENPTQPNIPEATAFPAVTQSFWQIGCLPQTSNGEEGEAFLAVSPNGTKYWLNHLVGVRATTLSEQDPFGSGQWLRQGRMLAWMYVTRIEDRFGNWVEYTYDGDQLDYIEASDGRRVDLTWLVVDGAYLVSDIEVLPASQPAQKWHYSYATQTSPSGLVNAVLTSVALPDQSIWTFALNSLSTPITDQNLSFCGRVRDEGDLATPDKAYRTATIKHPSGLTGTFTFESTWHGRSYVMGGCMDDPNHVSRESIPPLFGTMSLVSKKLSGPGFADQVWTFDYSPAVGSTFEDACAAQGNCPDTSWVDVTDPKGNRTRHIYSTRWGTLEGKELQTNYYQGPSTLLRTVTMSYAASDRGPYPSNLGSSMMDWHTNIAKQETLVPLETRNITQQGITFTHDVGVQGFDSFAREIDATDSSTLGSKRIQTSYYDNQALWVLGQIEQVKCVAPTVEPPAGCGVSGTVMSETAYNTVTALPVTVKSFGKLQQTMSYYADGTLHTVTDGRGNTTSLSSWYRGIPQRIDFADSTFQSAVVSPQGWITSVTDPAGSKTCYGYDAIGRVNSITYPSETSGGVCDTSAWNATSIDFVPVATVEYGIPSGHWRQTISTGNARKLTYFDALWRPVLVREYDSANVAGTSRFSATAYDAQGRVAHTVYPATTVPAMSGGAWSLPGVRTTYDALGRVTAVKQDSELGVLTTSTAYLSGFLRSTTDPRGNVTTERFQAFGTPDYEAPIQVDAPESTRTTIARDVFGKPTLIQRGATN